MILLPLTGFDLTGGWLGMGGGFYDRALADAEERPTLIGLAHECQKVDKTPAQSWDVPLCAQGDMGAPAGDYQQSTQQQSAPAYAQTQQQYSAPQQQSAPAYAQPQQNTPQQPASQAQPAGNFDDFDDDIPF